jgi:hypothetical protein
MLAEKIFCRRQSNSSTAIDASIVFGAGTDPPYYFASKSAKLRLGPATDRILIKEVQDVSTNAPLDFAHIRIQAVVIQGQQMSGPLDLLAAASFYSETVGVEGSVTGGSYVGLSPIWMKNSSRPEMEAWQIFQNLDTAGPVDLEAFEVDNIPWLAVANVSSADSFFFIFSYLHEFSSSILLLSSTSTGRGIHLNRLSIDGMAPPSHCINRFSRMPLFDGFI